MRRAILFALMCGLVGGARMAAPAALPPSVTVTRAWSRATPPGATVGVAYFEIVNSGAGDELTGIDSPAAQRVEMHSTTMNGGLMQMRQTDSVAVPAHGRVAFEPQGLHAMLIALRKPLKEGDRLALTLTFRHAGKVDVTAVVQGLGAETAPPNDDHGARRE